MPRDELKLGKRSNDDNIYGRVNCRFKNIQSPSPTVHFTILEPQNQSDCASELHKKCLGSKIV